MYDFDSQLDILVHKLIARTITDEERATMIELTNARTEYLKREGSDFSYMSRLRRWWLYLFRRMQWDTSGEDTQCFVNCCCGERLSVSDYQVKWCPKCGAGYSTEFRCYRYPGWLRRRVKSE